MERESFDNPSIAAQMNESFICIKVDREERPDLDEIYMSATVALSGGGGWPMTVFVTPEGLPFFAGTYFPPEDRHGRPGFPSLLTRIAQMWKDERQNLLEQAKQLTHHIQQANELAPAGGLSEDAQRAATRALARSFDQAFGGFGGAPKFPAPTALSLLLRVYRRTGQQDLLHMVTRTLDGMQSGGLFDQLGGGFARYSVDHMWLVPHFEKMLYDNAQLADVYVEGFQATGHAAYRRVAQATLDYLVREMQSPNGGFFSASDADSEGEESKYFVFTRAEVEKAIGQPAATHFCEFYGITDNGNFEGKNVLSARRSVQEVAKSFGIDQGQLLESLEEGRAKLLSYRNTRIAPAVDDKVVAGWNGLAIRALANAGRAFSEPRYLDAARRAADFILAAGNEGEGMRRSDGGLHRLARAGQARGNAFLEDYAFVADGLICLYEAGGGEQYLSEAIALTKRFLNDFSDDSKAALFSSAKDDEKLVSRPRTGTDSALPNDNAIACLTLARLAAHTNQPEWRERAQKIAASFATPIKRSPRAFCGMLCAADFLLEEPLEVALTGDPEDERFAEMAAVLGGRYLPNRVEVRLSRKAQVETPLTQARFQEEAAPRTHVCENAVCQQPVETAAELDDLLGQSEERRLSSRRRELATKEIQGSASAAGTKAYSEKTGFPKASFAAFGDLTVSKLGWGTHRVGLDAPQHREAARTALLGGVNLIDTSPSFAFGDSERLIGEIVGELIEAGKLQREDLVVISKVGVALGAQAEDLERKRKKGGVPHACPIGGGNEASEESFTRGAFCLDSGFLHAQIDASLERLGMSHLDICLIQSPEHFLAAGRSRDQLEEALLAGFSALEKEVEQGRIGRYGVLCNTCARDPADPLYVDFKWMLTLAKRAADGDHHFQILEVPINVAETAALEANESHCLTDIAHQEGVNILAVRPLSSMINGALLRLVDPPAAADGATADSLSSARYAVASLEAEFETTFAAQLRLAKKVDQGQVLPLSGPLGQALEQTATRQQFELAETTMLTPRLRHLLNQLDRAFGNDQKWAKFREKYVRAVGAYLAAVRETSTGKNRQLLAQIQEQLSTSPVFSRDNDGAPWVDRALRPLMEHPAIVSSLVGLRSTAHVEDTLQLLRNKPVPSS